VFLHTLEYISIVTLEQVFLSLYLSTVLLKFSSFSGNAKTSKIKGKPNTEA